MVYRYSIIYDILSKILLLESRFQISVPNGLETVIWPGFHEQSGR